MSINFQQYTDSNNSSIKNSSLSIRPRFSFMVNSKMEIDSYIFFSNVFIPTPLTTSNKNQEFIELGIGSGVHWHFIQLNNFRVASGVGATIGFLIEMESPYDGTFTSWGTALYVPLILELVLTPSISIRGTMSIINLAAVFGTSKSGSSKTTSTTFVFKTEIAKSLALGLYYRF